MFDLRIVSLLLVCICSNGIALSGTKIQVFATKDKQNADRTAQKVDELDLGPATVEYDGQLYKIATREFSTLAEANLNRPRLFSGGFTDVFAVTSNTGGSAVKNHLADLPSIAAATSINAQAFDFEIHYSPLPLKTVINLQKNNNRSQQDSEFLSVLNTLHNNPTEAAQELQKFINRSVDPNQKAIAELKRAYWLVKVDNMKAHEAFSIVAIKYPRMSASGEATLRMAYLKLRENNAYGAFADFRAVATGGVTAEPEVKLEAILRLAALCHRGRDLGNAAYWYSVAEQSASDVNIVAFCEMQRIGIKMETAWNDRASFDDVKLMCEQVLAERAKADRSIRATVAVMLIETLMYQNKHDEVIKAQGRLVKELHGTTEGYLGYYWLAKAHMEKGNFHVAANLFDIIVADMPTVEQRFKDIHFLPKVAQVASEAYEKCGRSADAKTLASKLGIELSN